MQDNSEVGIRATISRLSNLLQTLDPELWYHLNHKVKVCYCPCPCSAFHYRQAHNISPLFLVAGEPTVLRF